MPRNQLRNQLPSYAQRHGPLFWTAVVLGVIIALVIAFAVEVLAVAGAIMLISLAAGWHMPFTTALLWGAGIGLALGLLNGGGISVRIRK